MILIAGCGYVGERAADFLHAAGLPVAGVARSADSVAALAGSKPWPVFCADISSAESVTELAAQMREAGAAVTAFIHCASSGRGGSEAYRAVYLDGMRNLTATFPGAFPVFASSTSVYPQTDGSTVTEESPANPPRETGRLLLEAERVALDSRGAVARLAGLYGPDRSFVLKNLLLGQSGVEVAEQAPSGRVINQIHRDDAASALARIAQQRLTGVFNVVDDQPAPQGDCLARLAALFCLPQPGVKPPDPNRKRGWSHKSVSNARLRATGWAPRYPSYFDALRNDPDLVPSILQQAEAASSDPLPRAPNIVLVGLMGSGKSSVGRLVARKLGWELIDTDAVIVREADGRPIPEIFATEGEMGFRARESAVLRSLLGRRNVVIATGGGIVTQPVNAPILRHLGYVVWLQADPALLARRTAQSNDRPLLQDVDPARKLADLLAVRAPLYRAVADLNIQTGELRMEETAYGVIESARVFFIDQIRLRNSQCPD
jgi:shikimate kinase/nucleoside-diphosphate-sugar epimerase